MVKLYCALEWYSRGWRGAPAKGVGWVTAARVQIPLTPPLMKLIPFEGFFIAYIYEYLFIYYWLMNNVVVQYIWMKIHMKGNFYGGNYYR